MAFITTNVRLAAAFLLSLPVSAAIGREGARLSTIHFQTAAQKEGNANSPQMERLIVALAGEWTTEDTYEAGDHASRPRLGHARETYRVGPARLSLIEEYHGEDSAGQPWATGILWWDEKAHGVHVLWCDSDTLDRGCRVLSGIGKWEGNDYAEAIEYICPPPALWGRKMNELFKKVLSSLGARVFLPSGV